MTEAMPISTIPEACNDLVSTESNSRTTMGIKMMMHLMRSEMKMECEELLETTMT